MKNPKKPSDGKVLILKLLAEARDEFKPVTPMPIEELKAKYKNDPKTLSIILSLRASASSDRESGNETVRWFDLLINRVEKAKTPEDAIHLIRGEEIAAENAAEDTSEEEGSTEESEQNSQYSNALSEVLMKYYKTRKVK
jgi:hypothetical protein